MYLKIFPNPPNPYEKNCKSTKSNTPTYWALKVTSP